MKTKIQFLIIALIFTFTSLSAQLKVHIGSGMNISNMTLSGDIGFALDISSKKDFFISLRPELPINKKLYVAVDVQYSQKGYKQSETLFFESPNINTSYLDIIPQGQFQLLPFIGVYGGVGIGIRLNEIGEINDVWNEIENKLSHSVDPNYVLGIRLQPFKKFTLHAHYSGSLRNFWNVEFTNLIGEPIDILTRLTNIQVGVAYQVF